MIETKWVERTTKKPRLVIFDDDLSDLLSFVKTFENIGYEVVGVPVIDKETKDLFCRADGRINQERWTPEQLKNFTYTVTEIGDVSKLLHQLEPDCLLTDRNMGVFKGMDLIHHVKQSGFAIPQVMHTDAYSHRDQISQLDQAMAQSIGYMISPKWDHVPINLYFEKQLGARSPDN